MTTPDAKSVEQSRYPIECTACGFVSVFVREPKSAVCAHCYALLAAFRRGSIMATAAEQARFSKQVKA